MIGMSNIKAYLFTILRNKNPLRFIAFFVGFLLQFIVVEFSFMSRIFQTVSLSFLEWIFVISISALPLIIHELLVKVYKSNL